MVILEVSDRVRFLNILPISLKRMKGKVRDSRESLYWTGEFWKFWYIRWWLFP